ncbi:hypothetical protein [Gordonia sp. NPDC003422]
MPSARTDFSDWRAFGGIESTFADSGSSVTLDTNDTTETWSTKWSGLAMVSGSPVCSARIDGRVRGISHYEGTPGGFGIGLATLSGNGLGATLTGIAIQFDYGFGGYRTTNYPADTQLSVDKGELDKSWHQVSVQFSEDGVYTMTVDGATVVNTSGSKVWLPNHTSMGRVRRVQ